VESDVGKETTFLISLPLERAVNPLHAEAATVEKQRVTLPRLTDRLLDSSFRWDSSEPQLKDQS
jgi:hypothetical protein